MTLTIFIHHVLSSEPRRARARRAQVNPAPAPSRAARCAIKKNIDPMSKQPTPLVVQYLYVHEQGEKFFYPTARSEGSVARVAARYLECALVQAASLSLREVDCEQALVTNVSDRRVLGRDGMELLERIESLGVKIVPAEYRHRPGYDSEHYISSRYVLDAILATSEGQPEDRQLWLTDLDCVWVDAARVFAATPPAGEIGCIYIEYPLDWDGVGAGEFAITRRSMGELAAGMGGPSDEPPPWVGGELLSGTPRALRKLVGACEEIDRQLTERNRALLTEEQVLTLAGALGRVRFRELSAVAWRVLTGPRHGAIPREDALSLGLWHLPSEKGLSLRRTAHQIRRGHTARLRRDLTDPRRSGRRFNVAGVGLARQIRDDSWIARQRIAGAARSALGRR
jgi:hypothetical protein